MIFSGTSFNIVDVDKELFIIPHEVGEIDPTKFKTKQEFIQSSELIRPLNQDLFALLENNLQNNS